MKTLITGRPGTGKSTVAQALIERGYNAIDLEEVPGAVRLEYAATGQPAKWPEGFVDWSKYAWNIQAKVLEDLLEKQGENDVYVAVSASNQSRFYDLFDKLFVLTVDNPETLKHRLETRNVHEYNQGPENIARAVQKYTERTGELIAAGLLPLDNSRPLDLVLEDIVSRTT